MKIKFRDLSKWHRWFAWRPVCVGGSLIWLNHVQRRLYDSGWDVIAEYREKTDPEADYIAASQGE